MFSHSRVKLLKTKYMYTLMVVSVLYLVKVVGFTIERKAGSVKGVRTGVH